MKRGFLRRIVDALFEEEVGTSAGASTMAEDMPTRPAKPTPEEIARKQFDARLAQLIEERRDGAAGKLQFLDLDRLKEALGDRWPEMAATARAITQRVIEKRLAPGDLFTPHGDDGFLVLFVDLSPVEARIKAEAIAQEVLQRLTGELGLGDRHWAKAFVGDIVSLRKGEPSDPAPAAIAATTGPAATGPMTRERAVAEAVSQKSIAQTLMSSNEGCAGKTQFIDLEAIKAQFGDRWETIAEKARHIALQVIQRRLTPSDVFAPMSDDSYLILFAELTEEQARLKVAAIARQIQDRLLGELDVADRHKVKAFVTGVVNLVKNGGPEDLPALVRQIEASDDVAPPPRGPGVDAELQSRIGEVGLTYVPAWSPRKQVVSLYHTRVLRLDDENRIFVGSAAYPRHDVPVCFQIDRNVLSQALHHLRAMAGEGGSVQNGTPPQNGIPMIAVAMRLPSLIGLAGGQMVDLCRALPPDLRRFFLVEIVLPPAVAALGKLGEAVTAVQPFCRGITVRVPIGFTSFEVLARYKVTSVSLDLEELKSEMPPAAALAAVVQGAHAHKIMAALVGVSGPALARLGCDTGFDFLGGPGIARELIRPAPAHAWQLAV